MVLKLDHVQRLNLHSLLGAQRADVSGVRAMWAIQDKLALTLEEGLAIELKREFIGGQERVLWNPRLELPAKEVDFTDGEIARIRTAIETWDGYGVSADRQWLQPLMDLIAPAPTA